VRGIKPLERSKYHRRRLGTPPRRDAGCGSQWRFPRFRACARPRILGGDDVWRIDGLLTPKLYRNGCIVNKITIDSRIWSYINPFAIALVGRIRHENQRKRHCDPQPASRRGRVPRRRQRHFECPIGLITFTGRRSFGGGGRFGATACAARIVFSHITIGNSIPNSSNAMRAADAVAPNLAYPPEERLPTTDIEPLASSECRRRRRGAPPCRHHARGGGRFPDLLPLRARNRLWFGPTMHFRVGGYMANRRSINSQTSEMGAFD